MSLFSCFFVAFVRACTEGDGFACPVSCICGLMIGFCTPSFVFLFDVDRRGLAASRCHERFNRSSREATSSEQLIAFLLCRRHTPVHPPALATATGLLLYLSSIWCLHPSALRRLGFDRLRRRLRRRFRQRISWGSSSPSRRCPRRTWSGRGSSLRRPRASGFSCRCSACIPPPCMYCVSRGAEGGGGLSFRILVKVHSHLGASVRFIGDV